MSEASEASGSGVPAATPETPWHRPLPELDPVSTRYWEAAAQGQLLIQRCPSCGARQHYPRAVCTTCGSSPEWEIASGRGTVNTFTIVRQYGMPPFNTLVPYVVAMIDLEEGPRMMSNITDCDVDAVHIGMAVEVHMIAAEPGIGVPFFRPAQT